MTKKLILKLTHGKQNGTPPGFMVDTLAPMELVSSVEKKWKAKFLKNRKVDIFHCIAYEYELAVFADDAICVL